MIYAETLHHPDIGPERALLATSPGLRNESPYQRKALETDAGITSWISGTLHNKLLTLHVPQSMRGRDSKDFCVSLHHKAAAAVSILCGRVTHLLAQ